VTGSETQAAVYTCPCHCRPCW